MLRSWLGPLKQNAAKRAPGVTAFLLLISSLLIVGAPAQAAPAYTLAARIRAGYRPEISVRVNGADPFWCTLDSGAGGVFLLDKAIGEAAGLHGTRRQRGFGAGPDSAVDEIVTNTALQVDKLRLPRQSIHLRSLSLGRPVSSEQNSLTVLSPRSSQAQHSPRRTLARG